MKLKKVTGILTLLVLTLLPTVVFASESGDIIESGVTINDDLTLYSDTSIEEGATINGDVAIFGGELDLKGTINGDLIVFGGDVEVEGAVSGNIAVISGDLRVASTASISGECVLLGGTMNGTHSCFNPVSSEFNLEMLQGFATLGQFQTPPSEISAIEPSEAVGFFSAVISMLVAAIFIGVIAYVITAIIPDRIYEVRSAVKHSPYAAGGIGILTAIAGPSFLIITSPIWGFILLILSPVCGLGVFLGFAGAFYLILISLLSGISVGSLTGKKILGTQIDDRLVAAIGTGGLTFALGMLGIALPVLTGLLGLLLFSAGLGGVVLTKLGRQPFPAQPTLIDEIKISRVMSTLPQE